MTRLRLPSAPLLLAALAACGPPPVATAPSPAPAPTSAASPRAALAASLDSIFADTAFGRAFWGVTVRSLDTGETLYRRNAEKMFVPASNMKIVTAAATLEALGPDHRFRTAVAATGPIADGELRGDLVVIGSGDPTISARFTGDARATFRAWADSLRRLGVRRVTGSIVGDDDAFDDVPLGRGWAWDDTDASYSAEVSALQLNEGFVTVRVLPRALQPSGGTATAVLLDPPTSYVPVRVLAVTGAAGTEADVEAVREATGTGIVVTGTVPERGEGEEVEVAVRDNTLFFAHVLRETLVAAGIQVAGGAEDADARPGGVRTTDTLFVHVSPPMTEVLAAFLKPSQNQIGEILLKTLGRELRGQGTARAGVAVIDSLAGAWGLERRALAQADGSGLSRYNLVAPDFLADLLTRMTRSPRFAVFHAALPVAGADGTLASRMRDTPLAGNVRAKTGTLSGVRGLSGYLTTAEGERIVFSTIVNHHTLSARDADRLAEAALLRVYRVARAP